MADTIGNLKEKKDRVISLIRIRGPSLPAQISREIGLSILLTSALFSEMASDKMLKISNIKVGGSPLYFIPGQEAMLERFANYLPGKEKEAFELLKKKAVLMDERMQPAHRVALRSIKDFALPMKADTESGEKIFWRFSSFPKDKAIEEIQSMFSATKNKPSEKEGTKKTELVEKARGKSEVKIDRDEKKKEEAEFVKKVYQYLQKNNIELIEKRELKRKNILLLVRVNSDIGKFEMLLIAKEKKIINDTDLKLALNQGQSNKLPILLLSTGKLSKKAINEIENFKSYLIFKELA